MFAAPTDRFLAPLEPRRLMSGTAQFTTTLYNAGASPRDVVSADFNHDGRRDLAVIDQFEGVRIMLGQRNQRLAAPDPTMTLDVASPISIVARDFNNDKKIDLAVLSNPDGDSILTIYSGKNNGHFKQLRSFSYPQGSQLLTGDFNADGTADLAIVNSSDDYNSVSILYNQKGILTPGPTLPGGNSPIVAGVVANFNNDGRDDLATVDRAGLLHTYRARSANRFLDPTDRYVGDDTIGLAAGHFDAGVTSDLVVARNRGQISVFRNRGSDRFDETVNFWFLALPRIRTDEAYVADSFAFG